jgi:FixJ family two-component response regulator
VYRALECGFLDYWKAKYTQKRMNYIDIEGKKIPVTDIDINTPIDDELLLYDTFVSDCDVEMEAINNVEKYSPKMKEYIESLTNIKRQIAELLMQDYSAYEIKAKLHITERAYRKYKKEMRDCAEARSLYAELKKC